MLARNDIQAFIERAQKAGIGHVVLYAAGATDNGIVLPLPLSDMASERAADEAFDAAKNDTAGKTGLCRYALVALRDGAQWGRCAFVIDAGRGNFDIDDVSMRALVVEEIRDKRDMLRMV